MADNVEVKMGDTRLKKQNSGRLTGTYLSWRNRSVEVKIDRPILEKQISGRLTETYLSWRNRSVGVKIDRPILENAHRPPGFSGCTANNTPLKN